MNRLLVPFVFRFDPFELPISEHWSPMNTEQGGYTELVPINCVSLYQAVANKFHQSMPRNEFDVQMVFRVQNIAMWNYYNTYEYVT